MNISTQLPNCQNLDRIIRRTNHIKARIDKTQQKSKSRLYGDRDETTNHISEYSKLVQKENKIRHDEVGKLIHWELCKKFKFDHTNKWFLHNPASVLENETYKLLWNFDIQTNHQISARRPDLIIINNNKKDENLQNCGLCCPGWLQSKIERKKEKYLNLVKELKNKLWNMIMTFVPIVIDALGTVTEGLIKGLGVSEIRRWAETTQTTALLRSAGILETCYHWKFSERPSANADRKTPKE